MSDHLAIINATTQIDDAVVQAWTAAVQTQVTQHFAPAWGTPAHLVFVPRGQRPPRGYWQVGIFDDADQAGVLGYHDITQEGLPLGKVFAVTTERNGGLVSVTLSHEVLEMLADPDVNLLVQDGTNDRRFWAYEVCDAVEDDSMGYLIRNVTVSDFVFPAYFETFRTSGRFDYRNHLTRPVPALAVNGYMAYVEDGRWNQVFASRADDTQAALRRRWRERPHDGSRRRRRMLGRAQWVRSAVELTQAEDCAACHVGEAP